jgi:murein L,D-transpeptidase YcbB/YkuD
MSLSRLPRAASFLLLPLLTIGWSPATAVSPGQMDAALRANADPELTNYYRTAEHRTIWTTSSAVRPQATQLIEMLRGARLDGMDDGPDRAKRLERTLDRASSGAPGDLAQAELELSEAWVDYVQRLRRPAQVGITYIDPSLTPSASPARTILAAAAAAASLSSHIQEVSALNPMYAKLRQGAAAWQERWSDLPQVRISSGPAIGPNSEGERVALLRERLGLGPDGGFDGKTAAAVRAFKAAHGLPATTIVDDATIEALNQDRALVEQRLRLNLDRARALPARGRFVLVDAAAARLYLYEDGEVRDSMKVIVGKPDEQTPMMAGLIRTAVLNPYWNVPTDLVQRRVAPAVLKDGLGYLKTKRYEILSDWTEAATPVDPSTIDWEAVAAGRKELRVRQLPGAGNSMGAVKFMFPNEFGVYLHDTPDKALFAQASRTQSSGCVRVEDAAKLSAWLFGTAPRASSADAEQVVALPQPVPVFLNYFTAGWSSGSFALRQDPYGRDSGAVQTAGNAYAAAR